MMTEGAEQVGERGSRGSISCALLCMCVSESEAAAAAAAVVAREEEQEEAAAAAAAATEETQIHRRSQPKE